MPLYEYKCEDCGHVTGVVCRMADVPLVAVCDGCGSDNTIRQYGFHGGNKEYGSPIVSQSLAMNPNQITEHNRMFPDVKVTDEGCPVFTNYKQHDDYLQKTGFSKQPGKKNRRSRAGATVIRLSDITQEMNNGKI